MFNSQINSPKNFKKDNGNNTEDQKTIERLRFLLKNAIQLNDELEKKNNLLQYRIEELQNQPTSANPQLEYQEQIDKLQSQIEEVKKENQLLQSNLEKAKLSSKIKNDSQGCFQINLQACQIPIIEQQFYDYFEKQDKVGQEQIILEFQKRYESNSSKQNQLIKEQQNEIEELKKRIENLEQENAELKLEQVEQHSTRKQILQDYGNDFFGSNQFEIFSSRINNSQRMDEVVSSDKKWIDLDNNDKSDEKRYKEFEKIIEQKNLEIEQLQDKISKLKQKKRQLKLQNSELSSVMYQQAETCQKIISSLQGKVEKQKVTISYFQSLQFMKTQSKHEIFPTQMSSQNSLPQDSKKKFTYNTPNQNNSPVSLAKTSQNGRFLKKQDSSNDQTRWNIKTTDASLVKKTEKKDSQSESTSDQIIKSTKLSIHLQEVKKSIDQISSAMQSQKQITGYYFVKNKPILTLEDF